MTHAQPLPPWNFRVKLRWRRRNSGGNQSWNACITHAIGQGVSGEKFKVIYGRIRREKNDRKELTNRAKAPFLKNGTWRKSGSSVAAQGGLELKEVAC